MRRALLDLGVVILLVFGDVVWRSLSRSSGVAQNFITLHIVPIWITWVSIVAAGRAAAAGAALWTRQSILLGVLEWTSVLVAVHVLLCWLDTIWEPKDNFATVLAFTVFTLLLPSAVISSAIYVLMAATRRTISTN